MWWLAVAARLPGRALHVAVAIWFQAGIKGVAEVRLPSATVQSLGISRFALYRGLAALETAGLVRVDRRRGRCPGVTLLDLPPIGEA
jgi:hypothetical protein